MSDAPIHVAFLGGYEVAGNVRTLLRNLRRVLEERPTTFDCDLVVSRDGAPVEGYEPAWIDVKDASTARERIVALTRRLRAYAKRDTPDVLFQVTKFPTHGTAVALAGRSTGTPTITRLAGDNFREHRFARGLPDRARTYALKNVIAQTAVHLPDAVIALGPNGRADLATRFRRRNVRTIPQPVDREQFSPAKPEDRARHRKDLEMPPLDDGRVLLTVGRVSRRKGAEVVQRVAPQLSDDTVWYVVGDGPKRSALGSTPGIETVGRVPHDRIAPYYRAADLYVHPSLHDGLPNTLLEATACGTPSVARDVGECATVAAATFDDVDELREQLETDYDRVALDERFDPDGLGERYESLLTEVAR